MNETSSRSHAIVRHKHCRPASRSLLLTPLSQSRAVHSRRPFFFLLLPDPTHLTDPAWLSPSAHATLSRRPHRSRRRASLAHLARRPRWLRASQLHGRDRVPSQGGRQHQQVAYIAWQSDRSSGCSECGSREGQGSQEAEGGARSLSRLSLSFSLLSLSFPIPRRLIGTSPLPGPHLASEGLARWQLANGHDRSHRSFIRLLRRDPFHFALCRQCEEDQDSSRRQRGVRASIVVTFAPPPPPAPLEADPRLRFSPQSQREDDPRAQGGARDAAVSRVRWRQRSG